MQSQGELYEVAGGTKEVLRGDAGGERGSRRRAIESRRNSPVGFGLVKGLASLGERKGN